MRETAGYVIAACLQAALPVWQFTRQNRALNGQTPSFGATKTAMPGLMQEADQFCEQPMLGEPGLVH